VIFERVPVGDVHGFMRRAFAQIASGWAVEHLPNGAHAFSWQRATFNAADFFAVTGTATVERADVQEFEYVALGDVLIVNFNLQNITLSGAGAEVRMRLPGRYRALRDATSCAALIGDNTGVGMCVARRQSEFLGVFRLPDGTTAWTDSTNNTGIRGQIMIHAERF
jgi:hypothetical protein